MKRFAVLVATDEYAYVKPETPFCHNDALLLKETLVGHCDYAEQDILVELLAPGSNVTPIDLLSGLS